MMAPPGGFNDSALIEIFQETIPQFKLETTNTGPDTPSPVSSSKTTAGQSAASKPPSPTPALLISGSLVGGIAALVIAGGLLYVFHFRRQAVAANPSELPIDMSADKHHVQEVHGDYRPSEIDGNMLQEVDGNMLLEIDSSLYVEAPAGILRDSSNAFEMPSSIDQPTKA